MSKKLFLGTLAMTVALPVIVAPVQAQEVRTEISQDFKDVSKSYSFYKEIMAMRNQGIIGGYLDNTFKPAQSISRVHVASLLVRSLDLPPVRVGKEFKDVPKTSPYYEAVQKVYRAGIFDGNTNGTFGINDNLTRAQMAKVMVNGFNLDIHKGYIFSDVSTNHWAMDYITSLYMSGITVGSNGKYMPNVPVSRAHYAAFLYRALNPDDAPKPAKPLQPTPEKPLKPDVKPELELNSEYGKPNIPHPNDIKPPSEWDKLKQESIFKELQEKNGHNNIGAKTGVGYFTLNPRSYSPYNPETDFKEYLEMRARWFGISYEEFISIINQVIETGEVYNGGSLIVYYDYSSESYGFLNFSAIYGM